MGIEFPAAAFNPLCLRLAFLSLQLGQRRSSGGGPTKEEGLLFTECKAICQNQEVEMQRLQDVSPVPHVNCTARFL